MPSLVVCPHGAPAREALWRAIDDAKGADPLAPVTVASPSPYAGLSLRRALATRPGRPGLVNVRFLPLSRVAELVGAPALAAAGRRPLTPALRAAGVRAVLDDDPGVFTPVAGHPATEQGLDASFLELRRADDAVLDRLVCLGTRPAHVVRLYRAFRDRTAAFYDEEALFRSAAAAVAGAASSLTELGRVVLHLPTGATPAEEELLQGLARARRLSVVIGVTGDAGADNPARELAARLSSYVEAGPPEPGPTEPPSGTAIVHAPDPEDEVRAVLRRIVERATDGTPLHRMAVLHRNAEPYARLTPELLTAADLPWNGPSPRRLADSVAGSVLLGLLRLAETGFARDAVAAWLTAGPVLEHADGEAVPSHRWDVLSRRAGVVRGSDQWRDRLARQAERLAAELDELRGDDEAAEAMVHRVEADLESLGRLRAFVDELVSRVAAPEPATWEQLARWARTLLDRYLGGETRRRRWPERELEAGRRVAAALEGLGALDAIRARVDVAAFRRSLEAELEAPQGRVGRYGAGVFVGPVRHAYGADFDVVFVLGMAEGAFPPRDREDPLVPDRDREAAGGALPRRAARRAEEQREYLAALAAAPERVLSFPRAEPRAQRKRLPARWLLDSTHRLGGAVLGAEDLLELPEQSWLEVVPSFEAGVTGPRQPGSVTERDLRSLRAWQGSHRPLRDHPDVRATPGLAAGLAAGSSRALAELTAFDGMVGRRPGLLHADRVLAPTALEEWATCPFRYLLGRVLQVTEVERPEETETISPLERGSLVHAVLEEFVRTAPGRTSPGQPWSTEERLLLRTLAERHCDEAEQRGVTGRPLLWRLARRRILREVDDVLSVDEVVRSELQVVPLADGLELEFGRAGSPPVVVELGAGRTVAFRGRIDRVDIAPTGSPVVVFDYKTGGSDRYKEIDTDPVVRGTQLQLPAYALAARRHTGAGAVHAYYWFTRETLSRSRRGYELTPERQERFREVVETVVDGIESGAFPARPGAVRYDGRGRDTWVNCCYCPYDRVCPTQRDEQWERKRNDPAADGFRRLAEPEDAAP